MIDDLLRPKEKKVEYIELIYDLIFVYIVGRNNLLLHNFENGFVAPAAFLAYIMTTLAVIQIWNYTTYYINILGKHGVREHIFLFINMFLLYFIGEGTRSDWQHFHTQYHIAWALILINIGVQYLIEFRNHRDMEHDRKQITRMVIILFAEAVLVLGDILLFQMTGTTWISFLAILFGIVAVFFVGRNDGKNSVDFNHLTERAMLYVVFTFGEMIIAIASYFDGDFSIRSTYFALMAFLIVVGLFLSYGVFYDRIIDREKKTSGQAYMFLHIILIFALNNITNGLEFMREEEISLLPKSLFLVGSFLLYFVFLFALGNRHAKAKCKQYTRLCLQAVLIGVVFGGLLVLLRAEMMINILLTVVFVFTMFVMLYWYGRKIEKGEQP